METTAESEKRKEFESIYKISTLLDAGFSRQTISTIVQLLECGFHPESIADGNT